MPAAAMNAPSVLAIGDLQAGYEAASRIALNNPPQAEADLCQLLDSLFAAPPDGETYFRLLEHLRASIAVVAEELARRYLNKPLPLAELEEGVFQRIVALWLKTARAYAHCAENDSPDDDAASHSRRVALILHRCIHHTGLAIIAHQRARRDYPWGLWHDLHGYYASAEEWGVATQQIPDVVADATTDCTAAYIAFLLSDMAGCYSLTVRQQALVRRWAMAWSPLVSLQRVEDSSPQYVIDLMQDVALRPLSTEHLRRLDTSRLSLQIIQTRERLRQKIPPAELALGDDCTSGQCRRLLDHLSHPWSQARAPRKFRRHDSHGSCRVCTGFDDIHYFISGREFEQPDSARTYSRREFEALGTFRHQDDPRQVLQIHQKQLTYNTDSWKVANTSANGFRLTRSSAGRKMAHGQLLSLCPHDGERFLLAQTTWLMQEKSGGLVAGIRTLPGIPLAIAARRVDVSGTAEGKFARAFLLPAAPAVAAEQSLIIPAGWFKYAQVIELFSDDSSRVQLLRVLDDGPDFERVGFAAC